MCFKSCLSQGKPYPCRVAGFHVRESVAVRAGKGIAICIAHGRKRGIATVLIRLNAGRGRKLSVFVSSPQPRPVHVNNRIHRQSVITNWQWQQLSANRQRQRSENVHRQAAILSFPHSRIGHGRDLSAIADRQ